MVSHLGDKFPTFDIGELRSLAYKDDDKVDNLLKDRILTGKKTIYQIRAKSNLYLSTLTCDKCLL